jgi:hypothetical protein
MVLFFLLNISALIASYRLVKRFSADEGLSYRLLALAAAFYSQIILTQLSWGVAGKLWLKNLVLTSIVIFALSHLFFKRRKAYPALSGSPKEITFNKTLIFCFSLLLGFALVKVAINLVNPPFGWDCLNYHFTFPVEWMKHGSLQNPITINDDLGPSYYPINGGLIYLWLIYPLQNVFLADLGQMPFFIISFIALYGICRKLGIPKEYSLYAACLFSITPNYFKQMEIAYVDVMACAWFLLSCYFLLSFYYQRKLRDAVFFSLGLGMLIGTKTVALPYAAVLFVLFILQSRGSLSYILIPAALIILTGGYAYIRNFIQTGNPLYPLNIQFLGHTIFKGVFEKSAYTAHISKDAYAITKMLFSEGMGAGLIIFVIPGFLMQIVNIFRKKISIEKLFVLLMPLALYFIWRYLIPLANLRYLYAAFAISYIAPFMLLLEKKPFAPIARVFVILCLLASCAEISKHLELVSSLLLSAILFFSFSRIYDFFCRMKIRAWLITIAALAISLHLLNIDYNKNEYKRYISMVKYSGFWPDAVKAWRWLNENTGINNIAYVGRPVPFPLYGTNFKNNVFYVSVNKVDPAMAHYFPDGKYSWGSDFMELHQNLEAPGNYREHPDYALWLANLKKRKADYLFVYSLHQTREVAFPVEDAWAGDHPDRFSLVFSNPTIHIYKIN